MAKKSPIVVFRNHDMTSDEDFTYPTTVNYGMAFQLSWNNLSGKGKFKVQGSLDNIVWSDYCLVDCGDLGTEFELEGVSENKGIEIKSWYFDYIRIKYDSNTATSGNLEGKLTLIDNQKLN